MNVLDRIIAAFAPVAAVKRAQSRMVLASYEAAQSSRLRKFSRNKASGNALAKAYAGPLRDQARNLDRNHDIARGILTTLVNNTVGPNGITVEPQPIRMADGRIHDELARILTRLWADWCKRPEVTFQMNFAKAQRMACRAWLRDGEIFAQRIRGPVAGLDHRTKVPYSLELLESDMVPHDVEDGARVQQGIELNTWGQAVSYRVYKVHPGDSFLWQQRAALKTIKAVDMLHAKRTDRVGQLRGVSEFASVITRLEDIKDYEESERIAAKIAASMAAYIKKGTPDLYAQDTDSEGNTVAREMRFAPGMVFDDLLPGEDIGMIDTNRPNTNLQYHRDGQLRAASAGVGVSYSSASRNYNGTYSAQRQELVEQWVHYQVLAEEFTAQFVHPIYEDFIAMARASGLLPRTMLEQIEPGTLDAALFIGQQMPWIDPAKEAEAFEKMEANFYMSAPEIIRRRGGNPQSVIDQEAAWHQRLDDAGLDRVHQGSVNAPAQQPEPQPNGQDQTA